MFGCFWNQSPIKDTPQQIINLLEESIPYLGAGSLQYMESKMKHLSIKKKQHF